MEQGDLLFLHEYVKFARNKIMSLIYRGILYCCFFLFYSLLSSLSDGELEASEPEPEPEPDADPDLSDPDSDPDLDLSNPSTLDSEVEGSLSSPDLLCDPEHPPASQPKSPSESDPAQKQPQCGGHAAHSLGGGNKCAPHLEEEGSFRCLPRRTVVEGSVLMASRPQAP